MRLFRDPDHKIDHITFCKDSYEPMESRPCPVVGIRTN
jgi:hypothetical protein